MKPQDWTSTEALYAFVADLTTGDSMACGASHPTPPVLERMIEFLERHRLTDQVREGYEEAISPAPVGGMVAPDDDEDGCFCEAAEECR